MMWRDEKCMSLFSGKEGISSLDREVSPTNKGAEYTLLMEFYKPLYHLALEIPSGYTSDYFIQLLRSFFKDSFLISWQRKYI